MEQEQTITETIARDVAEELDEHRVLPEAYTLAVLLGEGDPDREFMRLATRFDLSAEDCFDMARRYHLAAKAIQRAADDADRLAAAMTEE